MRRAKIICTLGPASQSAEVISALIEAGMDVARLNFSHGSYADHAHVLETVREQARRAGKSVAVLQDLQGPKIRVGEIAGGEVELVSGAELVITTTPVLGTAERVSTIYTRLPGDVKPGDTILLDDGLLRLEVIDSTSSDVRTRVIVGGTLRTKKGINLPGVAVSAPALTDKDRLDLKWGIEAGVDYMALSFVRSAADVLEAKRLAVRPDGRRIPVIAKLEKPEAVMRLEEILNACDGLMVARGDLGVELGPEKVPVIQKEAIQATNRLGKIVITATEMLESMITSARPTRAEASDVANAVLDGTDALMLSGETARGKHPVLVVKTMATIIEEIEQSPRFQTHAVTPSPLDLAVSTNAIAQAAVVATNQLGIKTIAVYTESGGAARLLSEWKPHANIVAYTTRVEVYRSLALYWGVTPRLMPPAIQFESFLSMIEADLKASGFSRPGEMVAITVGVPLGKGNSTNLLQLHKIS
jgi:pyruvate kinase